MFCFRTCPLSRPPASGDSIFSAELTAGLKATQSVSALKNPSFSFFFDTVSRLSEIEVLKGCVLQNVAFALLQLLLLFVTEEVNRRLTNNCVKPLM